jgi:uncharacterized membrane protein YphA (DoxX/SURF4 family)
VNGEAHNRLRTILAHLCALCVAGVFLYAAFFKIAEPRQFALDIKNYQILPEQLVNLAAIFLPWFEVGAAVALILPPTRRGGAVLITAMCLMFIAAVSYAGLYKGLNIDCGCFGKHSTAAGLKTIILDVVLIIATAVAVFLPAKGKAKRQAPAAGREERHGCVAGPRATQSVAR